MPSTPDQSASDTPNLLVPWLAIGAGLLALHAVPNRDVTSPAAASPPPISIAAVDPSVLDLRLTLDNAPKMTVPVPITVPRIRFAGEATTPGGIVDANANPSIATVPNRVADRLFTVNGAPTRTLPVGFTNPLVDGSAIEPPAILTENDLVEDAPSTASPTNKQWADLRWCESSGNYKAISVTGKYRGAYQFDLPTWESVGGRGDPAAASPAEQDRLAIALFEKRGKAPWPYCGRYLG